MCVSRNWNKIKTHDGRLLQEQKSIFLSKKQKKLYILCAVSSEFRHLAFRRHSVIAYFGKWSDITLHWHTMADEWGGLEQEEVRWEPVSVMSICSKGWNTLALGSSEQQTLSSRLSFELLFETGNEIDISGSHIVLKSNSFPFRCREKWRALAIRWGEK